MARVELSAHALGNLDRLTETHSPPPDTLDRVWQRLVALERFPELGPRLTGRWEGQRHILGPWRWMVIAYSYFEDEDRVLVTTIVDARSRQAPTH